MKQVIKMSADFFGQRVAIYIPTNEINITLDGKKIDGEALPHCQDITFEEISEEAEPNDFTSGIKVDSFVRHREINGVFLVKKIRGGYVDLTDSDGSEICLDLNKLY